MHAYKIAQSSCTPLDFNTASINTGLCIYKLHTFNTLLLKVHFLFNQLNWKMECESREILGRKRYFNFKSLVNESPSYPKLQIWKIDEVLLTFFNLFRPCMTTRSRYEVNQSIYRQGRIKTNGREKVWRLRTFKVNVNINLSETVAKLEF